ncbi:prolipoprotein diacylglyceryl transferase [Haliangium sp.]|uniref:prolipoprotein diacylglyceryl transferase n=1 Tax=Haliangium sp. TaxID=2663208 RepID=UPI003D0FEF37
MQEGGLPYFTLPSLDLFHIGDFPVAIQPFGVLVALGVILGATLIYRRADKVGLSPDHARGIVVAVVVWGFIGAHVIDVLAYQPGELARDPLVLIKFWAGLSSFGGFIGGGLGGLVYLWRHKLPGRIYADTVAWGLLPGFTIGRLGCSIVHDHIGRATDFPLAMNYTAQVVAEHRYPIEPGLHHNLGLYEFLYLVGVCLFIGLVFRTPRRPGLMFATIVVCYAPVRFLMDYLRIESSDPRYAGLTFAQWVSVAIFVAGGVFLFRLLRGPAAPAILTPEPGESADGPGGAAGASSKGGKGGKQSGGGKKKRKKR